MAKVLCWRYCVITTTWVLIILNQSCPCYATTIITDLPERNTALPEEFVTYAEDVTVTVRPKSICQQRNSSIGPQFRLHNETDECFRVGQRGPCLLGQLYVEDTTSLDYGKCIVPDVSCATPWSPEDYSINEPSLRFYTETGKCEQVSTHYPCGLGQAFFYVDAIYGQCECHSSGIGKLLYWPPDDTCYYQRERGPCESGYWLLLDATGSAACKKKPCADKEVSWPDGKCYSEFYVRGPCPEGSSLIGYQGGYCQEDGTVGPYAVTVAPKIPCGVGYRNAGNSQCKEVFESDASSFSSDSTLCMSPLVWNSAAKRCELD